MDKRIDFLYLSEQDLIQAGVMDMHRCVEVMTEVMELVGVGDYIMGSDNHNSHGLKLVFPESSPHANMPLKAPDRRFMCMPGYLGGRFHLAGDKWYGSNRENKKKGLPRSILMTTLSDAETGAPIAYLSGNLISAMRTGAMPGVGAQYLARKDAKTIALVGPGVVTRSSFLSLMDVCKELDTVKIYGTRVEPSQKLADYISQKFPQIKSIALTETMEDAIRDSDIVMIATSGANTPHIKEEWLKPGVLCCMPASITVDEDFIIHRARNVVDNWKMYEAWEEEYGYPVYGRGTTMLGAQYIDMIHEGKMDVSRIEHLGEIIAGKASGRKNDDEKILYTISGMVLEDMAWGYELYQNALKMGIGTKLNLWDEPAMF